MLSLKDIKIVLKGEIEEGYKGELDRLFFFNRNQLSYKFNIEKVIDEFSIPVLKHDNGKVAVIFRDEWRGQTLHVLDGSWFDAAFIGVNMYERESKGLITIVHMALHERCNTIHKNEKVNIAMIIFEHAFKLF